MDSGTAPEIKENEMNKTPEELQVQDLIDTIKAKADALGMVATELEQMADEAGKDGAENRAKVDTAKGDIQRMSFWIKSVRSFLEQKQLHFQSGALDELKNLWVFQTVLLEALDVSEKVKQEVESKISALESKYDVSHNGILNYLKQVQQTNPWFQSLTKGETETE